MFRGGSFDRSGASLRLHEEWKIDCERASPIDNKSSKLHEAEVHVFSDFV